jgi:TonB family protein
MRNAHSWILVLPFAWCLAASPVAAVDQVTTESATPPTTVEESCGRIVGGVFAVKDVENQNRSHQGLTMPTVVPGTKVTPTFSDAARKAGGKVQLRAVVCKDGSVQAVQVVRAPTPDVGTAAAEALKKWKFNPAVKDGQAVAMRYMVSFDVKP